MPSVPRRTRLSQVVLVLAAFFGATIALPSSSDARRRYSRSKRREARKVFKKAELQYKLGNFKGALALYSKAYELVPLGGFLFNIGQCHRLLGNFERAIFFYEGFLRESRSRRRQRAVRKVLEDVKAAYAKQQAEQAAERRRQEQQRRIEEAKGRAEAERIRAAEAARQRRLELRRLQLRQEEMKMKRDLLLQRQNNRVTKKWWFWTTIGGVVAAAVATSVGLVFGLKPKRVLPEGTLGVADQR